ncbi:hypothetical protein DYI26_20565 [Halomonas litopenaei]|nr:hypothetical protein [Halomonas litopenaei]
MRKRSLRGVNEHFDPIFNAVLPSAGTFQTSPKPYPETLLQGWQPCPPSTRADRSRRSTKTDHRQRLIYFDRSDRRQPSGGSCPPDKGASNGAGADQSPAVRYQ